MITLKKFLTESQNKTILTTDDFNDERKIQSIETAIQLIKKDCGKYLNEIKHPQDVIAYRGIKNKENLILTKNFVRFDRKSKDTSKALSNKIDNWFKKMFNIAFRSSAIFIVGNISTAMEYGQPFIIFPIGDYDYCWSERYSDLTEDFFTAIKQLKYFEPKEMEYLSNYKLDNASQKHVNEIMIDGNYKFNIDLYKALTKFKQCEVMISCDNYYALACTNIEIYKDILAGLKNDNV